MSLSSTGDISLPGHPTAVASTTGALTSRPAGPQPYYSSIRRNASAPDLHPQPQPRSFTDLGMGSAPGPGGMMPIQAAAQQVWQGGVGACVLTDSVGGVSIAGPKLSGCQGALHGKWVHERIR